MNPLQFLQWAEVNYPEAFRAVLAEHGLLSTGQVGAVGLGAVTDQYPTTAAGWLEAITDLANTVAAIRGRITLEKVNAERARQGLPPITVNEKGEWVWPDPSIRVPLPGGGAGGSSAASWGWGAGLLAGGFLLSMLIRR